ncbi:DegT/DnrJ/EryC1/StrS family aminotransferase [Halomarina litorea]|uniref:DegT/DnrJ/EryC1/StrS family aminotransferase n=1 Tax=Halomarina litorea TaxID=2961595 RepID=UPI0034A4E53C
MGEEEKARVMEVMDEGMLADGPEVRSFEREFADYVEADHGVATSNGTTALHAAMKAIDVGPGDTVVTTPFTYIATANAVSFCNADIELVDIDPETYNIDPDALEARLADGLDVDAVIAVHLYGLPAAMGRLRELADEYDFALVEDAAQAHGAAVDGTPVGSLGDVACFSFYPTKNMTTGEGGMITTNDEDLAVRARRFVDHGRTEGYDHPEVGHNFRMTSIAAAIGRVQLDRLPGYIDSRRENARVLTERLTDTAVTTPVEPDGFRHTYNQYTLRYEARDDLMAALEDAGVGSKVYYPKPVHMQGAYDHLDVSAPVTERAVNEVLSVPVHPQLSEADVRAVADAVREAVSR